MTIIIDNKSIGGLCENDINYLNGAGVEFFREYAKIDQ